MNILTIRDLVQGLTALRRGMHEPEGSVLPTVIAKTEWRQNYVIPFHFRAPPPYLPRQGGGSVSIRKDRLPAARKNYFH
jgi:hypothetical protein